MRSTANAATEIAHEHRGIDALAARIATLPPGSERTELVHRVCARFMIHTHAEERYVHPAVRRGLRHGPRVAAAQSRRNRAVARMIAQVEADGPEDAAYDELVLRLVAEMHDHVRHQNAALLPALIDELPLEEIDQLGERLHDGLRAAREAAVRAGIRVSERTVRGGRGDGMSALLCHIAEETASTAPAGRVTSRVRPRG